jgi:alpha-tubulin suppressor-like RCC1 family protein
MNYVALRVLAIGASVLVGCNTLTGVNDLEVVDGASGVGGASGTGGGGTGGGGTGGGGTGGAPGGAAGSDAGTCEPGQKSCDGQCVSIDAPAYGCTETGCDPCSFENATATCADLACQFVVCNDDWLDCDSDSACETLIDDGNACTENICGHPPKDQGAPCNQNGGTSCDGDGNCVRCAEHDVRCAGNQPQMCDADGVWNDQGSCQGDTPACSEGYCTRVSSVAAGGGHTCALLDDSTVRCWGDNARGQLGNGEMGGIEPTPVVVIGLNNANVIFAGAQHTCAIDQTGGFVCWGANDDGQIGNDTFGGEQLSYIQVGGLTNVQLATLGSNFTCAYGQLNGESGVYCWGGATKGQLGNASTTNTYAPTSAVLLSSNAVLSLSAGDSHACASLDDGNLQCWGNNSDGQLGNTAAGSMEAVPLGVPVANVETVAAGGWHTCAINVDGLHCWGADSGGQVGSGAPAALKEDPVLIADASEGFDTITAGGQHTCGTANGNVLCWGRNNHGQLGIGGDASQPSPVVLGGLPTTSSVQLSAGGAVGTSSTDIPPRGHTCAKASDGNIWCWGANDVGQLGTGNTFPSEVPVPVKW